MMDFGPGPPNGSHTLQWNLKSLTEALQMMFQTILLESSPSIRKRSKVSSDVYDAADESVCTISTCTLFMVWYRCVIFVGI